MDSVDAGQRVRSEHDQEGQEGGRSPRNSKRRPYLALGGVLAILAVAAWATQQLWLPRVQALLALVNPETTVEIAGGEGAASASAHTHGGQSDVANADVSTLELSAQGRENIGLTLETVTLGDFERTITIPATLVERPGRTQIVVSAPMTGTVTRIYPIRGEAVTPGTPLFDLRMTHEDLVEKQSSLLRSLEELDVVQKEVARLEALIASEVVPGKRLLEQQYEQQRLEASIRAERQALLLYGMSDGQIKKIVEERLLQQNVTISAPGLSEHAARDEHEEFLQVAELPVSVGEHVQTGVRLATLADHCQLYIEGRAFEQDADVLNRVADGGTEITALVEGNGSGVRRVRGLRVLHVENEVQRESRALKFYVLLPNELVRNELTPKGQRFIGWQYRPGQRVEILVPVDRWERRIVLPLEAVVEEGPERYVFREVQGRFERRAVHVEYRDQRSAVIESDGTLFPGDKVAARGAYQIHLALKKKAGGGSDAHAGHHH